MAIWWVLLIATSCLFSTAQVGNKAGVYLKHPLDLVQCRSHIVNHPLPVVADEEEAVRQYLQSTYSHLTNTPIDLLHVIESPGGRHYTFQQRYGSMKLFDATIKVNLDNEGRVRSVFDNGHHTQNWDQTAIANQYQQLRNHTTIANLSRTIREKMGWNEEDHETDYTIKVAVIEQKPTVVAELKVFDRNSHAYGLWLFDTAGNLLYNRDLNAYHGQQDAATGLVFLPDPLTTAEVSYSPPYVDDSDNDVAELNNERVQVTLDVTENTGVYSLENDFVKIVDISQPTIAPVVSVSPVFEYTRAESGFEDVNAFYHISTYHAYVVSLGFNTLGDFQIQVDPHALNGDDNSLFSPASVPPRLLFGEGGVDDAEDADVVIHEYGHGLSYSASPNSNSGFERQALDEAFGDYIATSYSRSISEFNWQDMFTWDGHNEYWSGRNTASSKTYPDDVSNSIHQTGEIWSSMMMELWELLGQNKTDRLAFQSLFSYAQNISLEDAAMVLLQADTALFNGENFCTIYPVLLKRGLVDTLDLAVCVVRDPNIGIDAGKDRWVCVNDSVQIGNPNASTQNLNFSWFPVTGLSNPNVAAPLASPNENLNYTLTVSTSSGSFNTDNVVVKVVNCEILLSNTEGFADGSSNALIQLPESAGNTQVEVFDTRGKRIFRESYNGAINIELSSGLLTPGVYILRVQTDSAGELCTKLAKVK